MDIVDQAIYKLIHGYQSGAPDLSRDLQTEFYVSIKPGTLMNKANPEQPHQLTVREGLMIQRLQGSFDLLYAEAHLLNHSAIALGDFNSISDMEFLNTYTRVHQELGNLAKEINEAFEDQRITRAEVREINNASMKTCRAILEMMSRVRALCDEQVVVCRA